MSFLALGRIYQFNPALVSVSPIPVRMVLTLSLFQLKDLGRSRVKLSKCLSFKVSDLLLWNKGLPDGRLGRAAKIQSQN